MLEKNQVMGRVPFSPLVSHLKNTHGAPVLSTVLSATKIKRITLGIQGVLDLFRKMDGLSVF